MVCEVSLGFGFRQAFGSVFAGEETFRGSIHVEDDVTLSIYYKWIDRREALRGEGGAVTGIDGQPGRGRPSGTTPRPSPQASLDRWGVRGGEQEGGGLDAR